MEADGDGGTSSQADQLPEAEAIWFMDGKFAKERQRLDTGLY